MFIAIPTTKVLSMHIVIVNFKPCSTYFSCFIREKGEGSWEHQHNAGVASVSLQIVDTNDNSPIFQHYSRHQKLQILEDTPTGTVLTTLQATDLDEVN